MVRKRGKDSIEAIPVQVCKVQIAFLFRWCQVYGPFFWESAVKRMETFIFVLLQQMELSSGGFARYDKCHTKTVFVGSLILKAYCVFQFPEENGITVFKLLNKQAHLQINNNNICFSQNLVILFFLLKQGLGVKTRNNDQFYQK